MPTKTQIQANEQLLRSALDTILRLQGEVASLKAKLEAAAAGATTVEARKASVLDGAVRRGVPNTFAGPAVDFGALVEKARRRKGAP